MVKTYYRLSASSIFLLLLDSFYLGIGVWSIAYATIRMINSSRTTQIVIVYILIVLVILVGSFFLGRELLSGLSGCIKQDDSKIYAKAQFKTKFRLQYPAEAKYIDIVDICIIVSSKATNGEYLSLPRSLPFLQIKKSSGELAIFSLNYMFPSIVKRLLTDLKQHMKELGNDLDFDVDKLVDDFKKARFSV